MRLSLAVGSDSFVTSFCFVAFGFPRSRSAVSTSNRSRHLKKWIKSRKVKQKLIDMGSNTNRTTKRSVDFVLQNSSNNFGVSNMADEFRRYLALGGSKTRKRQPTNET